MSVDNWTICPKCKKQEEERYSCAQITVQKAYGKVSAEEYDAMKDEAGKRRKLSDTLREDYEVYMDDEGTLTITYSCCCRLCGWKHTFSHKEDLIPMEEREKK